MMPARIALGPLALALLAACSATDSIANPPGNGVRADEARLLALGLAGTAQHYDGSALISAYEARTSGQTSFPFTLTVQQQFPCPSAGGFMADVIVAGSRTRNGPNEAVTASHTGTVHPVSCAIPIGGGAITVSGMPDLAVRGQIVVNPGRSPTVSFTANGVLSWDTSDGRSGSCALDFTATGTFGTTSRAVRGKVCGQTLNFTGNL
jgi:hypothetical protein